jgi:putative methionine-R-sulfoxide reductase with GAF domain
MSLSSGTGQAGPRQDLSLSPTGHPPGDSGHRDPASEPATEDAVDLIASVAELQRLLVATESVEDFLQGLAALAAGLLSDGLSCGVAVEADGKPVTAACSDEVASQIDEVQYLLGEGPCLVALRDQKVVSVEDTAQTGKWPGFAPQAAAYGIRSCLSVPLTSTDRPMGALNLYSPVPRAFGSDDVRRAEEFAGHASDALAVASRLAAYTSLVDQLRTSLVSRAVIDQALGVIMGQKRCTQSEAFGILREASQQRNIKLRELAREVVTEVSGEPPQPPPVAGA